MKELIQRIHDADWIAATGSMQENGFAILPGLFTGEECDALIRQYNHPDLYRKTVVMERYRFGLGEYKYFDYPLPGIIHDVRTTVYPYLVPIANAWFKTLNIDIQFPLVHQELLHRCHTGDQQKATALILKYGKGGFNTLHQDLYGAIYFPIQVVFVLNRPGEDFTGGEFVLTQQIPRAQSKAIVLQPGKGDALIFTTHFKPAKGSKGYYRVNMKHGISEVKSGNRYALGIIFHDATS